MLPHANANLKKTGLAKTTTCSRRCVMSGWDEERIMGTWESDVMFEVLIVWTLPFVQPTLACALLTASKSRFETNLKAFRKWFDMTWIPCFACIPALAFSHFHYLEKGPITCTGPTGPTGSTGPYGPYGPLRALYGPYGPFTGPIRALRDPWGPSNSPETDFTWILPGFFSVLKLRHTCWIISLLLPLLA